MAGRNSAAPLAAQVSSLRWTFPERLRLKHAASAGQESYANSALPPPPAPIPSAQPPKRRRPALFVAGVVAAGLIGAGATAGIDRLLPPTTSTTPTLSA